ncbi:MAG: sensor histidine kinase [Stomatobaculum sp.]|nr:sensor histidine kinase [Stomatobaculum sp.]
MKRLFEHYGIRRMIFLYFTAAEIVFASLVTLSLYQRMKAQYISSVTEEAEIIVDQTAAAVEDYLQRMIKLSDSLYYGVIKNADLKDPSTAEKATILYDSEKERISNIGVFSGTGELEFAVPAARVADSVSVKELPLFSEALSRPDALLFSPPHVQRTFAGSEGQYRWGLTLARAVEIRERASTHQGVLMMELLYSGLQQYFDNVSIGTHGYIYMIGSDGEILYHPRMQLIESGIEEESQLAASAVRDGTYSERYRGENRHVTVKTVGYTGWKLAGVTSERGFYLNNQKNLLFMGFIIGLLAYILALVNAYISSRITTPIRKLEHSVNVIESGDLEAEVYIGGAEEIRHLGTSVQKMADRIRGLMQDIVTEHETRRRTEFDALQSQINPHFLYNTLDIIVWMIENEEKEKAVQIVTALGRFFRISLSRGRSIIPVKDELEHVRNYLMIQQNRFKNKFTYRVEADDAVLPMASVKLILQPIVENAIYHGMEFMDGDGEILVKAELKDGCTVMTVRDNGLGMTEETVEKLLSGDQPHVPSRRGSGIGVRNVHERIRIYFGEDYGLSIVSEPDEGTKVTIRMPAVPFDESRNLSAGKEGA